jgi:hypothetical protein
VPNASTFRTNLDLGDVALIDLSNNANTILNGRGEWIAATIPPGGIDSSVQFNDGNVLSGDSTFTYDAATEKLFVSNVEVAKNFVASNANIVFNSIADITIQGGNVGDVLTTDGTGNLSWARAPVLSSLTNNRQVSMAYNSLAVVELVTLPVGSLVELVSIYVDSAYNGTPSISVGVTGSPEKYFQQSAIDLTVSDRWDASYRGMNVGVGGETVNIYYNNGGQATLGSLRVVIRYSVPL